MSKTVKWPLAGILLAGLVAGLFGVTEAIINSNSSRVVAEIPINATRTAEARVQQTLDASQTQYPTVPVNPISTPVNPTSTITEEPASTSTPMVGEDISRNCLWELYWKLYPPSTTIRTNVNDCLNLRDNFGIYPDDGKLYFVVTNSSHNHPFGFYHLLQPIDDIEINLILKIDDFSTKTINSDLIFGIGNTQGGFTNGQYVIYRVLPNNSNYYTEYNKTILGVPLKSFTSYNLGEKNSIEFSIHGLNLDITITPYIGDIPSDKSSEKFHVTIDSSDREAFWIGYSLRTGADLNANISDLRIIP